MFGLSDSDFSILKQILINPLKNEGCDVWIFGSRARGDHQNFLILIFCLIT